jgi:exodeoxyribonuclease III
MINKDNLEFTWYSNIGNGFRIDHAFINEEYKNKILNCFYLHNERIDKISDHSMMVLELDL